MPADSATTISVIDLPTLAGRHLGWSHWVTVTQEQIDTFAALTGDEQWIHVDPELARSGPFGTTIAHGFLTLSSSTGLLYELLRVDGTTRIVNYGLDRVRFPAPRPVGSRVRMGATVVEVAQVPDGYQVTFGLIFEREGQEKPVCAADLLFRYYGAAAS